MAEINEGVTMRAQTKRLNVGLAALAVLIAMPSVPAAAAPGQEPCRINADAAVIHVEPSKRAARAGIGYRDQKCLFHGYTRDVAWAHITMKGSGVGGWVDRHLISTAKEQLAPSF
ncbi:hypothetical protein N4G70_12595 [Streptomyces sp. ASQP_92]|uniref:hypothetical protein n=1 Tax=Streptomyces sp. ASQP_92 TaxID=2979116 RepID=UPI0021BF10F3|nr:hypothetical protein [Streptomyces sp. ASQP_92]MCT9089706.1 hypothetical protein [Streptomyces sp. ASQP_92]